MEMAYEMSVEALGLALTDRIKNNEELPAPSSIEEIDAEDGHQVIVEFDMLEYEKRHNSKAIKKTVSIPQWLNEAAVKAGVNFSQVLQEALMEKVK